VIGPFDMLIAAHALSKNLVLVTNNEKEFQRIPSLCLQEHIHFPEEICKLLFPV